MWRNLARAPLEIKASFKQFAGHCILREMRERFLAGPCTSFAGLGGGLLDHVRLLVRLGLDRWQRSGIPTLERAALLPFPR